MSQLNREGSRLSRPPAGRARSPSAPPLRGSGTLAASLGQRASCALPPRGDRHRFVYGKQLEQLQAQLSFDARANSPVNSSVDEAAGAPLPRKDMIPRAENREMTPHPVGGRKGAATEIAGPRGNVAGLCRWFWKANVYTAINSPVYCFSEASHTVSGATSMSFGQQSVPCSARTWLNRL